MFSLFKRTDDEVQDTTAEAHTLENPYCDDITCWCHTNLELHANATEYHPLTTPYSREEI